MLSTDIREYIIRPSLQVCGLWSESAEVLVYGTGMIETHYDALKQMGDVDNGGLGFFQIEPSDYLDICKWLKYPNNKQLSNSISSSCYLDVLPQDPSIIIYNLRLQVLLCRIHYYRVQEALPNATDASNLALYYKKYYNSSEGAAELYTCRTIFQGIIDG